MDLKFILLIICGVLFAATLITYIVVFFIFRKRDEERKQEFARMYADKDLAKMEYDCAVYDEETEKLISSRKNSSGQMTIEEVIKTEAEVAEVAEDSVFQTVDTEGMEEITGNYKP